MSICSFEEQILIGESFSGLTHQTSDEIHFKHVTAMADFAFRLKDQLNYVNEHSFNNFQLRAGNQMSVLNYIRKKNWLQNKATFCTTRSNPLAFATIPGKTFTNEVISEISQTVKEILWHFSWYKTSICA